MDYYLKTTSKEDFLEDLQTIGINIQMSGDYYQDSSIIIDWIGLIPITPDPTPPDPPIDPDYPQEPIYDTEINEFDNLYIPIPPIYRDGQHVNVRSIDILDITQFKNTFEVYPEPPYRMFS